MDVDGEVPELLALASYYGGQGGALWAAEEDGLLVGMVGTRPGAGGWELCKMYVDRGVRGGGLAQALLGSAERFAVAAGAVGMRLWSDTRFERAHRFYAKQGYARFGEPRALHDKSNTVEFGFAKVF